MLLDLDTAPLDESVVGKYLIFDNAERSDASYRIEEVVDADTVSIGCNSLVERFVDRADYDLGVVYTIAEGEEFLISMSAAQ